MYVTEVLFLLIVILWPTSCALVNNETRQHSLSLSNMRCQHDPDVIVKPYCRLKALARGSTMLMFGGVLAYPVDDIMVNLKHYLKNSKNIYMLGLYDVNIDACKVSDIFENPIIIHMLPDAKKVLGKILKECPYQGDNMMELL